MLEQVCCVRQVSLHLATRRDCVACQYSFKHG
jgi:hypothetical protein